MYVCIGECVHACVLVLYPAVGRGGVRPLAKVACRAVASSYDLPAAAYGIVGQASGIMTGVMPRIIPRGRALPRVALPNGPDPRVEAEGQML